MAVEGLDHVALPTLGGERLLRFYAGLGFGVLGADEWRNGSRPAFALVCGADQKINVHPENMVPLRGRPEYVRGETAEPGCGDLCFRWSGGITDLIGRLEAAGAPLVKGPVAVRGGRSGGQAIGVSVYTRDPDGNLIEFISYDPADLAEHPMSTAPHWSTR